MGQLPPPRGEDLPAHVLEDHRPRLQVHHQHGLELGLSPLQLHLAHRPSDTSGTDPQQTLVNQWLIVGDGTEPLDQDISELLLVFCGVTSPGVPPIWMNSLVMISTISRSLENIESDYRTFTNVLTYSETIGLEPWSGETEPIKDFI